jgi:hypothetical protein
LTWSQLWTGACRTKGKKKASFEEFKCECIILTRQARDKHRTTQQKHRFSYRTLYEMPGGENRLLMLLRTGGVRCYCTKTPCPGGPPPPGLFEPFYAIKFPEYLQR